MIIELRTESPAAAHTRRLLARSRWKGGRHPLMEPVAIVKTNRSTSLHFSLQTDRPRLDHVDHYLSIAEDTQSGWKMIYL